MKTPYISEPWSYHLATVVAVREKPTPNIVVANVPAAQMVSFEERQETARRIAACVNACRGIRTETLEKFNDTIDGSLHACRLLQKQRDIMLAAAENVVQCFGGDVPDWLRSNIDALISAVDSAKA